MSDVRLDIAVRKEGIGWVAYNVGCRPPQAERNWSTGLGPITVEEVQNLFRTANLMFLPPGTAGEPLDFTPYN